MGMETLSTYHIASVTELREPMKVLEAAKGQPVAILKNNKQIAVLVPTLDQKEQGGPVSNSELAAALKKTQDQDRPILDYLKSR